MARRHLERADIAVILVDASVGVTSHDATIASYAEQSGRSVIVAMNKWDLALEAAREKAVREKAHGGKGAGANPSKLLADYEPIVRAKFKFLPFAPIVFLSALTGERVEKLYATIDRVAEARRRRISTGELNRWLAKVDLDRGTSPASRKVKDLLRDAGGRRSAHFRAVHQSNQAAALQLSAFPGKPSTRGLRFYRESYSLYAAPEKAGTRARRWRRTAVWREAHAAPQRKATAAGRNTFSCALHETNGKTCQMRLVPRKIS